MSRTRLEDVAVAALTGMNVMIVINVTLHSITAHRHDVWFGRHWS